ncbi:hypothetical protein FAZ15_01785 [Sphingobacterium olei]|uniref:Uncharacterized protein n=1 Tax=Sphingobacterium olei TaxID=2571155 RepID=A0A4U0P6J9_9SPHI|nr:hypothetical protein [Sphingobacterium olei]TJZ63053.1 hypothetical protein FAZ15_01785 [Sphingobacterium olei]
MAKEIQTIRTILLLMVVVFSLLPCSNKASVLSLIDIDYEKPLNRVKTTRHLTGCFNTLEVTKMTCSPYKIKSDHGIAVVSTGHQRLYCYNNHIFSSNFGASHQANAPPKYILYKRLKIAVV